MTRFGYTLMTEQSGPKELVGYAVDAEEAGFDFEVSSDHYSPWLTTQGHAPYAWTLLGAVAQATSRVELATYVTCPTMRYHPAVVAQKAATMQLLSDGRFILGLGSGENLNEHVVGEGWPPVAQRQDMLEEAVQIIRELHTGELVTWEGDYFRVDSARIWDAPEGGVPIGLAVSGDASIERFAPLGDHLIAVEPDASLVTGWAEARGPSAPQSRTIGQIPISWDPDDRGGGRACPRPVPLVRRRLVGKRRPAHPQGLRGRDPVRAARGCGGEHPLWSRPRRHRRGGAAVLGGGLQRHRDRAGRR
jgi:G6PDH family F420-dependent oxidoreductase